MSRLSSLSLIVGLVLVTSMNFQSLLEFLGTRAIPAGVLFVGVSFGAGYALGGPTGELARAERADRRTWRITSAAESFDLVRTSIWRETWELRRFGEPAGSLSKDGAFTRTSSADLPDDLPLSVRLFVVCVMETLWERSRQSAAAGGASG